MEGREKEQLQQAQLNDALLVLGEYAVEVKRLETIINSMDRRIGELSEELEACQQRKIIRAAEDPDHS